MDEERLDNVAKVYELVIEAGVYRAESIKVAEVAKLIENCQIDVNITFINELVMDKMNIDTKAVIEVASNKWNFIKMNPSLVGGHCIGVDPYYLIHRARVKGVKVAVLGIAIKKDCTDTRNTKGIDIIKS
ncbi:hypothetical protein [Clostridium sp.]|uniref:hypothetical protein n=1 Tax=Clostridium sp. TaxID=1506 RepID=UPI003217BB01